MAFILGLIVGAALGYYVPIAWRKYKEHRAEEARRIP